MKAGAIIKSEHIKVIQHNIGNGVTEPKFATTDKNVQVVIKVFNGLQGNLVLFNEYLCYRLAILLDIKMPRSGICKVDQYTEVKNNCINSSNWGYGFYSTFLPKVAPLMETIVPLIKNRTDFYKILLFDHAIFNTDRNPGNLLVQYYNSNVTLQVIDHSHVFINQAIWDARCLEQGIAEKDFFSTRILENNSYLYNLFFRNMSCSKEDMEDLIKLFKDKITYDIINTIIKDIPSEWLPTQRDIDTLIKYLIYRTEHLEEICITINNYLNK